MQISGEYLPSQPRVQLFLDYALLIESELYKSAGFNTTYKDSDCGTVIALGALQS